MSTTKTIMMVYTMILLMGGVVHYAGKLLSANNDLSVVIGIAIILTFCIGSTYALTKLGKKHVPTQHEGDK